MMTSRGTPFSLATASMTSNSSLLIFSLAPFESGSGRFSRFVGFLAAAGLGLSRQPEGDEVRHQFCLLDIRFRHAELALLVRDHHPVAFNAGDAALQPATAFLRHPQGHLRLLAEEAR